MSAFFRGLTEAGSFAGAAAAGAGAPAVAAAFGVVESLLLSTCADNWLPLSPRATHTRERPAGNYPSRPSFRARRSRVEGFAHGGMGPRTDQPCVPGRQP